MLRRLAALLAGLTFAAVGFAHAQISDTPRRGGMLVFSVTGEPDTYDCHVAVSTAVLHRLAPHYSTLIKIDQATYPQIVGDVAQSWTVSTDGLAYSFRLRPNVLFHDGTKLTAADVQASFERIRNPPSGVTSVRREQFRDVAAIETPDPQTVIVRLSNPNAAMLTFLASPWNCLYSARLLADNPNYPARVVMGSGPFRFVAHVAGSEWRGERFDSYFREGRPYLDGFRAISIAGPALVNALAAGQTLIDFRGLAPAERDRVVAARGDRVRALEADQPGMLMLTFNTQRKPFDDPRVRQALNLAIDRWGGAEPMARLTFFSGVGGFQRPGSTYARSRQEIEKLPGFRPDMTANRAESRRLLAEAGQSNLSLTFTNRQIYTPLGIFLVDQWRQIGVTVNHEQLENQRFFGSRAGGSFDVVIDAIQDYVDEPSLQFQYFLSFDRNPSNISRAIDHKIDELYDRQARTLDVTERTRIVRELEMHLLAQAYTVPFYWAKRIVTVATDLGGFRMTPSSFVGQDLADLWLAH
jgi:peptide/nickel transport system substrate-binding protein